MKLTIADLIVLAVLVRAGPMHGYEVWRRLEGADVKDWARVSRPQVYYSLRKLDGSAYLERAGTGGPSLGPERTSFTATSEGEEALRTALAEPHWIRRAPPDPFTTWAALALNTDPRTHELQIQRYRDTLTAEIEREEATLSELAEAPGEDAALGRALVRMSIARLRTELQSLDDLRETLAAN